jgi:hypothetical protein
VFSSACVRGLKDRALFRLPLGLYPTEDPVACIAPHEELGIDSTRDAMSPIPRAPTIAPESIRTGIALAAEAWFRDPGRPRIDEGVVRQWDELLHSWAESDDMPILVRKARGNRGHAVIHQSGRILVPADNSPAHWTIALAFSACCPSLADVREALRSDGIPIAMVLKADEKLGAAYRCTRQAAHGPNDQGWKVAHIHDVGLGFTGNIQDLPPPVLMSHFLRFLSPGNMFLVPKEYAGIAETPEFLEAFRAKSDSD